MSRFDQISIASAQLMMTPQTATVHSQPCERQLHTPDGSQASTRVDAGRATALTGKQAQSKTRATMHLEFQLLRLTAASPQTGVRIASHVARPTSQARSFLSALRLQSAETLLTTHDPDGHGRGHNRSGKQQIKIQRTRSLQGLP
jgi:hypothetical protein